MQIGFHTEPVPPPRVPLPIRPGLARIVAGNPGPMTYHGTNSWLLEHEARLIVIDPGPDEPDHLAAIAGAGRIGAIVLTHTHADHAAGASSLAALTGAPVHGWHRPWARDMHPDVALEHGDRIGPLIALHTPGHASDHLCLALEDGTVFTGDHVMAWSTSVVIPPDGDMAAYMDSLRQLQRRNDRLYLPGHGPPLTEPQSMLRALLLHRATREAAILRALTDTPRTEAALAAQLYTGLSERLARAAAQTVQAHLIKLAAEGRARGGPDGWTRR